MAWSPAVLHRIPGSHGSCGGFEVTGVESDCPRCQQLPRQRLETPLVQVWGEPARLPPPSSPSSPWELAGRGGGGRSKGVFKACGPSTRCFGLSAGLLFSLQSPAMKAAQDGPAGAGGFDAAGRPGPSLPLSAAQPIRRLRTQGFSSGRDLKFRESQLPVDGLFSKIFCPRLHSSGDRTCAPLQKHRFRL